MFLIVMYVRQFETINKSNPNRGILFLVVYIEAHFEYLYLV